MTIKLELFYDVESSYSYLAFMCLDRYVPTIWPEVELVLRPALLGGVFKAVGNVPPITLAARAPYLINDMAKSAKYFGVPVQIPDGFPSASLAVMRLLTAVARDAPSTLRDVTRALYRRHWGDGLAVDTPEAWAACGAGAHADKVSTQDVKDALKAATDEAVRRGAFGFPAMFIHKGGDDDMYFGSDRIPLLAHDLGLPYRGPNP
ncbi:MAG TPA: DsbA family protein [Myxococcota bacterium]|jgi:2-hydroxychromene-2-carboxylate isomerase